MIEETLASEGIKYRRFFYYCTSKLGLAEQAQDN